MLSHALTAAGVAQLALSEAAFNAGLHENEILNPGDFIFQTGYCYRGFRGFPPYLEGFDISRNKKVLLIRDPRDMLVSHFFSVAFSHALPSDGPVRQKMLTRRELARAQGVDEFCRAQREIFRQEFLDFERFLNTEIRIFRYEDVIFHKSKWLRDMLEYFEISLPQSKVDEIASANDIVPDEEHVDQHVRQVRPGNHRQHLGRATLELINSEFSQILDRYGYER